MADVRSQLKMRDPYIYFLVLLLLFTPYLATPLWLATLNILLEAVTTAI